MAKTTIKKSNKKIVKPIPFSRLSKANKRIALAQDVIAQVKAKKYITEPGTYFRGWSIAEEAKGLGLKDTSQLQKVLPQITCECCAKGALLLSNITKANHCTVRDIKYGYSDSEDFIKDKLDGIFSKGQLDLIETAFECSIIIDTAFECSIIIDDDDILWAGFDKTNLAEKAIKFGKKYKNSNNRLIGIMNNIVANNGEFKP